MEACSIYYSATTFKFSTNIEGNFHITRKHTATKPITRGICNLHSLIDIITRNDADNWREYLFVECNIGSLWYVSYNCWLKNRTFCFSTIDNFSALLYNSFNLFNRGQALE